MRTTLCEGDSANWEDELDERERIASSITILVCEISADVSLKTFELADVAACAGMGLDIGVVSAAAVSLVEPRGCLRGIGLRPGIVVFEGGASRTSDGCGFAAWVSTG